MALSLSLGSSLLSKVLGYYYPKDIARKSRGLPPKRIVLICCEGAKTEPAYIEALRRELRLSSVHIEIVPGDVCGSSPKSIVSWAVEHRKALRKDWPDTVAWCAFDRDSHPKLSDALCRARDNNILVAFSNPSFELWLLLHFEFSTALIDRRAALRRLRTHVKDYEKGRIQYDAFRDRRTQAKGRAAMLRSHHETTRSRSISRTALVNANSTTRSGDNPSTTMDELVTLLESLQDLAR